MKLCELLKGIDCEIIGDSELSVTTVTHIAEKSTPDSVYICLLGAQNGHNYIDIALMGGAKAVIADKIYVTESIICSVTKKGATLIVVENTRKAYSLVAGNYYGNSHKKLKIIGIVGTNGKTTTAHLIYHILNNSGLTCGIIGTLGANLADGTAMETYLTTPDPMVLYGILDRMAQTGCDYVVMELSAHSIALEKCASINFYALAFTNLSRDHLDYFSSMEEYENVKHSIFLKSNALNFINIDDESGKKLYSNLKNKECITFSLNRQKSTLNENNADFYKVYDDKENHTFSQIDYLATYSVPNKLELISPVKIKFNNPLYGRFNGYNLLLAIAVCVRIGVDINYAIQSLNSFQSVDGRFVLYECKGVKIIIDFAHTPDGLSNLLVAAREITDGKLTVVFGAGGDRDKGKRSEMGRVAELMSDKIILTKDNPRSEKPEKIIDDIISGIKKLDKVYIELDRYQAIKFAFDNAKSGDTIVVAGKGHENYIEENGANTHYSDIESVEKIVRSQCAI